MANGFQKWLASQGYTRENNNLLWLRYGKIVSGKELRKKLNEWKALKKQ